MRLLSRTLILAFVIFFTVFGTAYADDTADTPVYGNWTTKKYHGFGLTNSVTITIEKDKLTYTLNCKRDMDDISVSNAVSVPAHVTSDYIQLLESSIIKIDKYGIECKANISKKKIFYTLEDNYLFMFNSKGKKKLITTYSRFVK